MLEYSFCRIVADDDFEKAPDAQMIIRFFELWTSKESFLKYTGTGIVENLNKLPVDRKNVTCEIFGDYVISVYSE